MSRPGFEPGPLEKSHLDSLSAGYSEPLLSRHLLTTFGPLQEQHKERGLREGDGELERVFAVDLQEKS